MKVLYALATSALSLSLTTPALSIDCNKPCGPAELLSCFSSAPSAAKDVYNKLIFNDGTSSGRSTDIDGYCAQFLQFPVTSTSLNEVQLWYINTFCPVQKGTYASYDNFIAAYNEMVALAPGFTDLACQTTPI